ncbi:nucleotidyltransferase domain-containing protein [Glaciibacter superstes]|uniref:nucleotidyltransferase domain-containing protein n=1 Tax=Glaciibacter superstes TaxID=501023 RepID=UPI0003B61948|nr:nucleotidyltransferase domain-containing protein [Glaciibacter superstes]
MNTKAPTLAPLFRSDAQGEILARLFLNPERSFTIAELSRLAKTPYASAHREVSRLAGMGLVTAEKRGQAVEVQSRRDTPTFRPLAELLGLTYGPAVVIPREFIGIAGIGEAYLYGSWAARREGESGSTPGDIDLLIVGNPSRSEIYEAASVAGAALGREVNPRIISVDAWEAAASDPFLRTLTERPLVRLDLLESHS